ncbi:MULTISPECIES: DMT family transporter [Agrobacterium]|uniref:DMT family transporter n=1 Tax=Agrobacterium TaxID=357 RepID=UPI001571F1CB|nr:MULTISPECIES: DMT family transporter [Agrobacterium]NSZ20290.1 DMT family transporter [Agrobacterium vitis]QZO07111.1 DMT family transporter [Agrobacterium vitis]UJL91206.1 DMT family transporter [Agrobacterium vitis]
MAAITYNMVETSDGGGSHATGGVPRRTATLIGALSIFFWATWPSLALFAAPAPTFQILAIGQAVGFFMLAGLRLIRGQNLLDMFPRSWGMLAFGIIGVLGTNAFNFLAITRIPAAQASIINYTWPIMALLMSGFLGFEKLHPKHYAAILVGFVGVVFVINPWSGLTFDLTGIGLALMAGVCYASYTIYRQFDRITPSDAVGIYGLFAAIACMAMHFSFETTQALNTSQWVAIILLGIAPMGLGYALWDYGVARGDTRLMSILAYGTPLLATLLLIGLGLAAFSTSLMIGAVFIIMGAALGTWKS